MAPFYCFGGALLSIPRLLLDAGSAVADITAFLNNEGMAPVGSTDFSNIEIYVLCLDIVCSQC